MQIPSSTHPESEDALFIERRNVYGCGMVVLTASISNGVVLLEQHPECPTISRELHALIPLISVEGIERLEAFLATVKKQMRAHEKKKRRPTTARYAG